MLDVRPPMIGITGRRKRAAQIEDFPESFAEVEVDMFIADYAGAIAAAGGFAVFLPQRLGERSRPADIVSRLDGLLLSGGADLHPSLYGAESETDFYPPETERDAFEVAVALAALDAGIPVLGICRGLQLLNVLGGGTLHQHVPEHARYDVAPDALTNELTIEPGSVMAECYGETTTVNSLHHQTIDDLARCYVVTARNSDGVIEAIEWPGRPVVAVQWHPELLDEASAPLFSWFVAVAADHSVARSA